MKKVITLMLVALMLVTLIGCGNGEVQEPNDGETDNNHEDPVEAVEYVDGTYEGEAEAYKDLIKVIVEVTGGNITKVEITEHKETEGIADPALDQIPSAIVEKNSPDVDVISGATLTSQGIIDAVKNALEDAKK
jgi:uncharacterized protein with FMN-binding domain